MATVWPMRPAGLVLGAMGLIAACAPAALEPPDPTPPDGLRQRQAIQLPEVDGIWLSGGHEEPLLLIVRFTQAMDTRSVEQGLRLLAADDIVRGPGDGAAIEPAEAPQWGSDDRELLLRYPAVPEGRAAILTLSENVTGRNGLRLDGATAGHPGQDPVSYHRRDDDGFAAPASYVSLPYFPAGSAALDSHPPFQLHDQRPGVECRPPLGDMPVTRGSLGRWDGQAAIRCRMLDRRWSPNRPGQTLRHEPRLWNPAAPPQARFIDGAGRAVSGTVDFGSALVLPARDSWRVDSLIGDIGLRLEDAAWEASGSSDDLWLIPDDRVGPVWAITGVTAPNIIWIDPVIWTGDGTSAGVLLRDAAGTWSRNELVGHRFEWDVLAARIVANRGAELTLETPQNCTPCRDYRIVTRLDTIFGRGSRVRIGSPAIHVSPTSGLAPGEWRLELSGGRDLRGFRQTNGLRNGDEVRGVVNNTVEFRLEIEN